MLYPTLSMMGSKGIHKCWLSVYHSRHSMFFQTSSLRHPKFFVILFAHGHKPHVPHHINRVVDGTGILLFMINIVKKTFAYPKIRVRKDTKYCLSNSYKKTDFLSDKVRSGYLATLLFCNGAYRHTGCSTCMCHNNSVLPV